MPNRHSPNLSGRLGGVRAVVLVLALLPAGVTRPLAADELTTVRWPGNQARSVLYDAAGRATQVTDERGIVRQHGYDAADRLTTVSFPAYPTQELTLTYDAAGRVTHIARANGDYADLVYDAARKRLASVTTSTGGYAYTVSYTYHGDGKVATLTTPIGTTAYAYTAAGQVASITGPQGDVTLYTVDHAGRLTGQSTTTRQGRVIGTTWAYGVSGQPGDPSTAPAYLRGITHTVNGVPVRQHTLTHSYLGQVLQRATTGTGGLTEVSAYAYDDRGRITGETNTLTVGGQQYVKNNTYTWDLADNVQGGPGGWTYNSNNQLTSAPPLGGLAGATGLSRDAAGNLTSANGMTFTYDPWGRLSQAAGTPVGTVTYQYDVLGRRAAKTVGGATTQFLYDGEDLVGEAEDGDVTRSYVWGPDGLISDGIWLGIQWALQYVLEDDSGDTEAVVDEAGLVTRQQATDAYVQPYWGQTSGGWSTPWQRGGYQDAETGLVWTGATHYVPSIGQMATPGEVGGGYTFAGGDPVGDAYDELGECDSYRSFLGKAGQMGVAGLTSVPAWQPGSRDRVQISGMLDVVPVLGTVKMGLEALTGRDWVGGTCLTGGERLLRGVGTLLPVVGSKLSRGVSGLWSRFGRAGHGAGSTPQLLGLREYAHCGASTGKALVRYWPPNNGFAGTPVTAVITEGTVLWRYGGPAGSYLAPRGATPLQLSLPPAAWQTRPTEYIVRQPFAAQAGTSAPWPSFGTPGGGQQYYLGPGRTIQDLLNAGILIPR